MLSLKHAFIAAKKLSTKLIGQHVGHYQLLNADLSKLKIHSKWFLFLVKLVLCPSGDPSSIIYTFGSIKLKQKSINEASLTNPFTSAFMASSFSSL